MPKENLVTRMCGVDTTCQRCGCDDESLEHILFLCPFATAVWRASNFNYNPNLHGFGSFKQWWDRVTDFLHESPAYCPLSLIATILWNIWKQRNSLVFQKESLDPIATWHGAADEFFKYQNNVDEGPQTSLQNTNHVSRASSWTPPNPVFLKINCDAAKDPDTSMFGIAAVCRNCSGTIVEGRLDLVDACEVETAEAQAIRMACTLVRRNDYTNVISESDCINIIRRLQKSAVGNNWRTQAIEKDILHTTNPVSPITFSYVSREGNKLADWAA